MIKDLGRGRGKGLFSFASLKKLFIILAIMGVLTWIEIRVLGYLF